MSPWWIVSLALSAPVGPIPVQGMLLDANGAPVTGTQTVTIRLYGPEEASPFVETTAAIAFAGGGFAAEVGGASGPDVSAFASRESLWVTFELNGIESDRVRVGASPLAMVARHAVDAEQLGGLPAERYAAFDEDGGLPLAGADAGCAGGADVGRLRYGPSGFQGCTPDGWRTLAFQEDVDAEVDALISSDNAFAAADQALDGRVSSLESSSSNLTGRVGTLETGASALSGRVTTVETTLSAPAAPVGQVVALLSNTAPSGFLLMNGQTIDKVANPEYADLVTQLQALGFGSGNTATVPNWNDGRVITSSSAALSGGAAALSVGTQATSQNLTVSATGTATIARNQFDTGAMSASGGSWSAGSLPSLSWPTYTVPNHSHSKGDMVAAIGSAGGNIGSLAFEADNAYNGAGCTYTVTGGGMGGCQNGYRNHNTRIYGNTGGWSGDTSRSGGSWSAGSSPSLSWPTYAKSYTGDASGSVSVSGSASMDLRRGLVKYAIRFRS